MIERRHSTCRYPAGARIRCHSPHAGCRLAAGRQVWVPDPSQARVLQEPRNVAIIPSGRVLPPSPTCSAQEWFPVPRYPARLRRGLCAALLLVAVLPAPLSHTAAGMAYPAPALIRPLAPTPMWTRSWGVYVRSRPAAGSPQLTQLDIDQELRVTGAATGADGLPWLQIGRAHV